MWYKNFVKLLEPPLGKPKKSVKFDIQMNKIYLVSKKFQGWTNGGQNTINFVLH